MVNIFMTVYGKVGLRELAKQNLAKTAYAAEQFGKHAKVLFAGAPRFNEFVVETSEDPYAINGRLLGHKIVGGFPLKKFYPELGNASLWCCTELTTRSDDRHGCRRGRRKRTLGRSRRTKKSRRWRDEAHDPQSHRHVSQNEGLIFEKSSPGKAAWKLPPLDVPEVDTAKLLGTSERKDLGNMPEVSEIEIIRHFTRLSTWNYAIDLGMYPLGSCTMKYNPRVNEVVSRLEGLANGHPYQPEKISQGALRIMKTLSDCLIEITGMDAITLQPAAGAHGELTGLLMVRAYHESKGNPRKKILIPDSAHGTNPATAAMVGYAVENLKSNARGMVDVAALEAQMNEDVAALMLTNPNTLGVFEQEIHKIADILHAKGGLLYMDGANMNALVGKVRPGDFGVDVMHLNLHKTFSTPHGGGGPGSGPVAIKKILEPFLPTPVVITKPDGTLGFEYDRPQSVGRVRAFYGNFGMFVRALAYILPTAPTACARPPKTRCSTPTTFARDSKASTTCLTRRPACTKSFSATSCRRKKACSTMDIAKRLIDYGFHPYTTAFPLIVPGALMIEPTESESKEEMDLFIEAMKSIAEEVEEDPQMVLERAAHHARLASRRNRRRAQTGAALEAAVLNASPLYFFSIRSTEARVVSQSACIVHESPLPSRVMVKFSIDEPSFEAWMSTRAKSSPSPG